MEPMPAVRGPVIKVIQQGGNVCVALKLKTCNLGNIPETMILFRFPKTKKELVAKIKSLKNKLYTITYEIRKNPVITEMLKKWHAEKWLFSKSTNNHGPLLYLRDKATRAL